MARLRLLLAVKYRFVGDAVCATPALRAARQAWPEADIALPGGPIVASVLHGCPYFDRFVAFAPRRREWEPWENLRLLRRIRALRCCGEAA